MQGKIIAFAVLIFGVYILISVFSGKRQQQHKPKAEQTYHIGCYDIDRPLSSSREAQRYISQLTDQFNSTSSGRMYELKGKIGQSKFLEDGGNEIARQFQKYIASYQNIKSRNQYQQSFYNTLKQTKDSFLQCREQFNKNPWNCRSLADSYNSTQHIFQQLKDKLARLMNDRADHLSKTEQLLRDEDVTKDIEFTEKYTKEIELLNEKILKMQHQIHNDNETLLNINNKIFRLEHEINSTRHLLIECSKNRKEIDYCKNISDYVTGLDNQLNLQEIQRSMAQKKHIIDLLKAHLIQSKKLGEDVALIEIELDKEKQELEELELLYFQSNAGKCSQQLQFRCSQESIADLEKNITSIKALLIRLSKEKDTLGEKIALTIKEKEDFETRITHLNQELTNNAVDIGHLKLKEERKKKQLQQYRETLNNIIISIGRVNKEIAEVKLKRIQENKNVDILMSRSEELIQCLGKKQLYEKLNSKKPKNTEQDEMLKHRASQSLTNLLKKLLGK